MGQSAESAKATRREWIGLAVIALPCLLYSMDLTVLNLALPEISTAAIAYGILVRMRNGSTSEAGAEQGSDARSTSSIALAPQERSR